MADSGTTSPRGKGERWNIYLGILASIIAILAPLGVFQWFSPDRPPVVVSSFDANPATVSPGGLVTLSWSVQNAESVVIEPSGLVGTVQPQGSRRVQVGNTMTFTLRAYAPGARADSREQNGARRTGRGPRSPV